MYRDKKDYEKAIAEYDKAIEADPKSALAYAVRGRAKMLKGDNDAATADLDKAQSLEPNDSVKQSINDTLATIKGGGPAPSDPDYQKCAKVELEIPLLRLATAPSPRGKSAGGTSLGSSTTAAHSMPTPRNTTGR